MRAAKCVFAGHAARTASSSERSHTGRRAARQYRTCLGAQRSRRVRIAGSPRAAALAWRATRSAFTRRASTTSRTSTSRSRATASPSITGVSGSGKSTLAFDILFAEGQRRYLESLNAYARQFVQPAARPDVDAIFGIPPTVAIEQRTSRGGRKSTVGDAHRDLSLPAPALREARHAALPGVRRARSSRRAPIASPRACCATIAAAASTLLAPLVVARKGYYTDLAKWAAARASRTCASTASCCRPRRWPRLDRFKEHTIELPVGDARRCRRATEAQLRAGARRGARARQGRRAPAASSRAGAALRSPR